MITYLCKYTPIEILEAFDTPVAIADPAVTNFNRADTLLHPNLCSFAKAVLEDFEAGDYEGMVFTTCCDSARRLYDTVKRLHPDKFFFCFDLPRKITDFSVALYVEQMKRLIAAYAAFSGKTFHAERLIKICADKIAAAEATDGEEGTPDGIGPEGALRSDDRPDSVLRVCLAGARPSPGMRQLIEDLGAQITLDITCTGIARKYDLSSAAFCPDRGDDAAAGACPDPAAHTACDDPITPRKDAAGPDDPVTPLLTRYAASLLGQLPCMRMAQVNDRAEALLAQADGLDGILYHTVKFCDIYSYEYTRFRETLTLPIVKLETDATDQCAGQIRTRVEAFFEALRTRRQSAATADHTGSGPASSVPTAEQSGACRDCPDPKTGAARLSGEEVAREQGVSALSPPADTPPQDTAATLTDYPAANGANRQGGSPMYILGIDSGSTSTNAVIINDQQEILSYAVLRTGAKSAESAERILAEVLEKAGLAREDLSVIVSTGYGRVSIPFADRNVTEISCHARGAHFLNPNVHTVLDIGGQDSKAIRLNENGDVIDFVMNDKCAAGTGRFLEMMADTLEIGIERLGPLSLQAKENVEISSMCSVFAESEVISLIAQNKETADIARGIHRAIAGKAMSLLRKVGLEPDYMMTGGVAKNPGMVAVLEEMLDAPLYVYEEPEIVGALGAALYGSDHQDPVSGRLL